MNGSLSAVQLFSHFFWIFPVTFFQISANYYYRTESMSTRFADTDQLVRLAAEGNTQAMYDLLERFRGRLRTMVALRLDRRIAVRVDPSDIVQEALADAASKLSQYARQQPVAFYPWLRRFAWQRLVKAHRQHVQAERRSVNREMAQPDYLSDESRAALSSCLLAAQTTPSAQMMREELERRVLAALDELPAHDREFLVLRYLEQLSMREIADVLGISEPAARRRHVRALERLERLLSRSSER
jgi:RNA polymerase sigma-70 factor (ECF subfamily)